MPAQRMLTVEEEKTRGSQDFDKGIGQGDLSSANSAFPAEEKKRDNRNIVIRLNMPLALRATRGGADKAEPAGKAVDDHVKETSPNQTEKDDRYLFHQIVGAVTSPVPAL